MSALLFFLAAIAADPGAGAVPASPDGLGCAYAQLGEAGRGVVARGFEEGGDGDMDSLKRATARLIDAVNTCSIRLHWENRTVRGDLARDYAMEQSLADFYGQRMRAGGADMAAVEAVYQGLPADQRLALYRHDADEYGGIDDKLAAELARRGEYAEDATWDTRMPVEVFPPLADAGGLDHDYPAVFTYFYIWHWYESRFEAENIARLWAMVDATP